MEPLTDYHGIEAASKAALETGRSTGDRPPSLREKEGVSAFLASKVSVPVNFVKDDVFPWYQNTRATVKQQVRHILWGDAPFYCHFRMTGVNILVLCSVIYMFFEVTALAFFPASWDYGVAMVGV